MTIPSLVQYICVSLFVLLQACEENTKPTPDLDRRELTEIEGEVHSLRSKPTLCELIDGADRVGVFTVERMYSQRGRADVHDPVRTAVTFIELEAEQIWIGADTQQVRVRTLGGTTRQKINGTWKDVHSPWPVSLAEGERIVYFEAPSSTSAQFGYPDIFEFTLFHEVRNGYASADLFVRDPISLGDFEQLVTDIADTPDGAPCPVRGLPTKPDGFSPPPNGGGADDVDAG